MRVEVPPGLHVCDADALATLDCHSTLTWLVGLPANLPVTVGIVCVLYSSDRLLSTACTGRDKEQKKKKNQARLVKLETILAKEEEKRRKKFKTANSYLFVKLKYIINTVSGFGRELNGQKCSSLPLKESSFM